MCDMAHSYVRRDLFIFLPILIDICDISHPIVLEHFTAFVLCLKVFFATNCSDAGHDAYICVTCLIHEIPVLKQHINE